MRETKTVETVRAEQEQHDDATQDRCHITCCVSEGRVALCGVDLRGVPWETDEDTDVPRCPHCTHVLELINAAPAKPNCEAFCPRNVLGDD